jgi:hypothetical protein
VASLFIDPNEENHLVPDVEVQYVLIWLWIWFKLVGIGLDKLDLVQISWYWFDMLDLVLIHLGNDPVLTVDGLCLFSFSLDWFGIVHLDLVFNSMVWFGIVFF